MPTLQYDQYNGRYHITVPVEIADAFKWTSGTKLIANINREERSLTYIEVEGR